MNLHWLAEAWRNGLELFLNTDRYYTNDRKLKETVAELDYLSKHVNFFA